MRQILIVTCLFVVGSLSATHASASEWFEMPRPFQFWLPDTGGDKLISLNLSIGSTPANINVVRIHFPIIEATLRQNFAQSDVDDFDNVSMLEIKLARAVKKLMVEMAGNNFDSDAMLTVDVSDLVYANSNREKQSQNAAQKKQEQARESQRAAQEQRMREEEERQRMARERRYQEELDRDVRILEKCEQDKRQVEALEEKINNYKRDYDDAIWRYKDAVAKRDYCFSQNHGYTTPTIACLDLTRSMNQWKYKAGDFKTLRERAVDNQNTAVEEFNEKCARRKYHEGAQSALCSKPKNKNHSLCSQ